MINDTKGDAVVEATILFPIIIMIFAALVILAMYLPTRAVLQRSTQYAATTIANTNSDTWLYFDEAAMDFGWETDRSRLPNVYAAFFSGISEAQALAEEIVAEMENRALSSKAGTLSVNAQVLNRIIYKEVIVQNRFAVVF